MSNQIEEVEEEADDLEQEELDADEEAMEQQENGTPCIPAGAVGEGVEDTLFGDAFVRPSQQDLLALENRGVSW